MFNKMFSNSRITCSKLIPVIKGMVSSAQLEKFMFKLDFTFPSTQFLINGFFVPHRLDQNSKGGGIFLYVKDKIIVLPLSR